MKVIITGATGMVGKGVLLECLDHEAISEVLVIGRSSVGKNHAKLKELIHEDFSDFSNAQPHLQGYDACYCCMGVSAAGMSETNYHKFTYDFHLSFSQGAYCHKSPNGNYLRFWAGHRFERRRQKYVGKSKR